MKPDLSSQCTDFGRKSILAGSDSNEAQPNTLELDNDTDYEVVGQCVECLTPYDELCGSRVCTVCRDLVLVCPTCQKEKREYHCNRHATWKHCYFSFLEVFDRQELDQQHLELIKLRNSLSPVPKFKNARRTLARQIDKVEQRIEGLVHNQVMVERGAPRRCRSCLEPCTVCNGRCWGFWKDSSESESEITRKGRRARQALEAENTVLRNRAA
mmetsp:Transcript_3254/g.5913  ORF Transcript_3254/g.5913 Transcript_3254/m.5913 type:complete len:213 (-) Transcript_3254:2122-2760(-)